VGCGVDYAGILARQSSLGERKLLGCCLSNDRRPRDSRPLACIPEKTSEPRDLSTH
jgi:hypothetical protein